MNGELWFDVSSPCNGSTPLSTLLAASATLDYACEVCGARFANGRKLSSHKWSKHGIRCKIRQFVDDETCCPVCDTEFYSRARLVKHLLEKRVRSRTRGVSCRDQFLLSRSKRIPTERVNMLDQRDANVAKAARRKGHTSSIADWPCERRAPSILLKRRPAEDAVPMRPQKRNRTNR